MKINGKSMGTSAALVAALASPLVAYYEGMIPHTYADPVGIPTICYGHTGPDVTPGRVATPDECKALLEGDLAKALAGVDRCIVIDVTPNQAAALVSFAYNIGTGALCSSTLARLANARAPAAEWCAQMSRWTYGTILGIKIELPGLIKRRVSERAMCEGGQWRA